MDKIKIMIYKILLFLSVVVIFSTCKKTGDNKSDIEYALSVIKPDSVFTLKNVVKEIQWDSVYITKPYNFTYITSKYNVKLSHNLERKLELQSSFDSQCILLFSKNNEIIENAIVKRYIADFSYLENDVYYPTDLFLISSDGNSRKVVSK